MRMLHTMLRVTDLERSLAFYTGVLGMNLLRRKDYPSGRFTLAFVGYGPETEQTVRTCDTLPFTAKASFAPCSWTTARCLVSHEIPTTSQLNSYVAVGNPNRLMLLLGYCSQGRPGGVRGGGWLLWRVLASQDTAPGRWCCWCLSWYLSWYLS